jgi:hypothetical protein
MVYSYIKDVNIINSWYSVMTLTCGIQAKTLQPNIVGAFLHQAKDC